MPPSIHPRGELIEFSEKASPALADFDDLLLQCKLMAATIELSPHWQGGCRHELSLAVAGALIRADVSLDGAFNVVKGICRLTGDEEEEDRLLISPARRNFRYWHKADIDADAEQCPLLGVKRTSADAP